MMYIMMRMRIKDKYFVFGWVVKYFNSINFFDVVMNMDKLIRIEINN